MTLEVAAALREARRQRGGGSGSAAAAVAVAALRGWAAWQQQWQLGNSSLAAVLLRRWQRQRGSSSGSLATAGSLAAAAAMVGAKKQQQSTKSSGSNSEGNGVRNKLIQARMWGRLRCSRYTAFFEQSIPVWNKLTYPTYVGIQYWQKIVLVRNHYILHTYIRT